MSKRQKNDIINLYDFYNSYKDYYNYYWTHSNQNTVTKEDIETYKKNLAENKQKIGDVIDAICMFIQVPRSYLFNSDGTQKELNEIEVLNMIEEANYGETND